MAPVLLSIDFSVPVFTEIALSINSKSAARTWQIPEKIIDAVA